MKREDWEREKQFIKSKKAMSKRHKRASRKAKNRDNYRRRTT